MYNDLWLLEIFLRLCMQYLQGIKELQRGHVAVYRLFVHVVVSMQCCLPG
jgi:hypothetical protein